MKINKNARVWAAPVIVLMGLGLLAGCGGGGGISNPEPTPSPSASVSRVTVDLQYLSGEAASIYVRLRWPKPSFVSASDVVEYHVYRNDTIIAAASKSSYETSDFGVMTGFSYYSVSANDDTRLSTVTASAVPPFSGGTAYTYRVTALYVTPESSSAATPVYAEAEIGQSETVTPYNFTAGNR